MTVAEREEVLRRSVVSEGSGLKYPAVNVHEEERKRGEERVHRMCVIEGSSVLVSLEGGKRGVSWERG